MKTSPSCVLSLAFVCTLLATVASGADAPEAAHSPDVRGLLNERLETLRKLVSVAESSFQSGGVSYDAVCRARSKLLDAELENASTRKERIAIHERHVENYQQLEKLLSKFYESGRVTEDKVLEAKAARLAAQIALQREREKDK